MGSQESKLNRSDSLTAMQLSPKKKNSRDDGDSHNSSTISVDTLGLEDFEAPQPIIMPMFLPTKNVGRNWQFWTLRSRSLQKAHWKHCLLFNFEFYTRFGFGELLYKRVSDTEAEFDTSVFFKLIIVEKVEPMFSTSSGTGSKALKQRHRLVIKGRTFQTAEYARDPSKLKQVKFVAEDALAKVCEIVVAEGDMLCVFGDITIDGADTVYLNNRFQHPVHVAHVKFDDFEEFDVTEEWYESTRLVCRDYVLVQEFMIHGEGEQAYHCQPMPDLNETDTSGIDTGGHCKNILNESDNIINGSFEEQLGSPNKVARVKEGKVSTKGKIDIRETPQQDDMPMEISNTDPPPSPPEIIFDPNLDAEFDKRVEREQREEKENLPKLRARSHQGNYRDSSGDESTSKSKRYKKKRELPQKPKVVDEITLSDSATKDPEDDVRTGKSKKARSRVDSSSESSEATVIVSRSKSLPGKEGLKQKKTEVVAKATPKNIQKLKVRDSSPCPTDTDEESVKSSKPQTVNSPSSSKSVRYKKPPANRSASKISINSHGQGEDSDGKSTDTTTYFEKVVTRTKKKEPLEDPLEKFSNSSALPVNKKRNSRPKRTVTEVDVYTISSDDESKSSSVQQKSSKAKPMPRDAEDFEPEAEITLKPKPMPAKIRKYLKNLERQVPNRQPCPQVDLGGRSRFKLKDLPLLPRASVSLNELPKYVDDYLHATLFQ